MPAKRVIVLDRNGDQFSYALWADVPAANQPAYRNPEAISAYKLASAAELLALRDGTVVEHVGLAAIPPGTGIAQIQNALENIWTDFQNTITAETPYVHYGRTWNGSSWVPGGFVPMAPPAQASGELPSYLALTPVSAFAANKLHFVLHNASASLAAVILRIRALVILPELAALTGSLGGQWTIRRRDAPTTEPAGGTLALVRADSADPALSTVTAHNAPTTAPAGGTVETLSLVIPQPDEVKASTLDLPGMASLGEYGGHVIYNAARCAPARPWTLRPNQTLEVVQGGTAGTGNCRVLCVFTVG